MLYSIPHYLVNSVVSHFAICSSNESEDYYGYNNKDNYFVSPAVRQCPLHVTADGYEAYMKPDSIVTIYLKGYVVDTKRSYAHVESFQVAKPGLEIEVEYMSVISSKGRVNR